nr:ABC transporter permease [Clostridium aceticum]
MIDAKHKFNGRKQILVSIWISASFIIVILLLSVLLGNDRLQTNGTTMNFSPSFSYLFGTDWLGRDMFTRTIKGLRLSLMVGAFASAISAVVATVLGVCAAVFGKAVDTIISWFIDLFIGMPHLVFILLISFMAGGGMRGVILGVSLTHWPSLARIIRAEVLQIKNAEYINISRRFGKSSWFIAKQHVIPHILPQVMIGFLLLFPHVILHEAGITFLGFGLSPQTPAIGIILSEAMRHTSTGMWWLAFFPGLMLVVVVKSFDNIGEQLRMLMDPSSSNE